MKLSDLLQARDEAAEFTDNNDTQGIPFDTIVTMIYLKRALSQCSAGARAPVHEHSTVVKLHSVPVQIKSTAPPDWFAKELPKFAGRRMTSSAVLTEMGRPTDVASARAAGAWLRAICGEPKRSNGQTLFMISALKSPPVAASSPMTDEEAEAENPYPKSISVESRTLNFVAVHDGETVTVQQVAMEIGATNDKNTSAEIWKVLNQHGRNIGVNTFTIGNR